MLAQPKPLVRGALASSRRLSLLTSTIGSAALLSTASSVLRSSATSRYSRAFSAPARSGSPPSQQGQLGGAELRHLAGQVEHDCADSAAAAQQRRERQRIDSAALERRARVLQPGIGGHSITLASGSAISASSCSGSGKRTSAPGAAVWRWAGKPQRAALVGQQRQAAVLGAEDCRDRGGGGHAQVGADIELGGHRQRKRVDLAERRARRCSVSNSWAFSNATPSWPLVRHRRMSLGRINAPIAPLSTFSTPKTSRAVTIGTASCERVSSLLIVGTKRGSARTFATHSGSRRRAA